MAAKRISVELLGDKELDRKLRALEAKVANKVVRQSMRAGFKIVLADAKRRAAAITNPANQTDLMFRVAKFLKLRSMKRRRGRVGFQIVTPTREKLDLQDSSSKWYPPAHIELGTKNYPAQPYLRGPLKDNEHLVLDSLRGGIWGRLHAMARAKS